MGRQIEEKVGKQEIIYTNSTAKTFKPLDDQENYSVNQLRRASPAHDGHEQHWLLNGTRLAATFRHAVADLQKQVEERAMETFR